MAANTSKFIVIFFVVAVVVTGSFASVLIWKSRATLPINQAGVGIANLHKAAAVWAQDNGTYYPGHISLLQANNYFRVSLFTDPRLPEGTTWEVSGLDARPFLEEIRRESNRDTRLDRAPLLKAAAADAANGNALYRYGDYWFVRLDRYRNDTDLIFGFSLIEPSTGTTFVVTDDGTAHVVDETGWQQAWQRDAERRAALGLPSLAAPAFDDPALQCVSQR
ncbi:MAG: hypothetical protein ACR2GY_08830 [Phycisphaerales bacterium]